VKRVDMPEHLKARKLPVADTPSAAKKTAPAKKDAATKQADAAKRADADP
jgi:hypothetical protein